MDSSENTKLFEYLNASGDIIITLSIDMSQYVLNFPSIKAFLMWKPVNSYKNHKYGINNLST